LGENGSMRKYYRERIEDGKVVNRKLSKEELISKPIPANYRPWNPGIFSGPYKKKLRMLASSYNPTVEQCGPWGFTTFTGVKVRYGIVAVDPKVIPLGTWLYVSGYGYALAADIGGAIKGNKIDCFFFTSHKGSGWRGGYIDVYILENEP
jgi:3D (Asp-Asp-Asp) domain-containing protein